MAWEVEYTDEFEEWWIGLGEEEQIDIDAVVGLLEETGVGVITHGSGIDIFVPLIIAIII